MSVEEKSYHIVRKKNKPNMNIYINSDKKNQMSISIISWHSSQENIVAIE